MKVLFSLFVFVLNFLQDGVPPDLSKNNTLYRNKIQRHPDLDLNLSAYSLKQRGIKVVTGSWTDYEMYLLLLNIKATKKKFCIKNFKNFFLQSGSNNAQFTEVMSGLAENLLRPRKSIIAKLATVYRNGCIDDQKHGSFYSQEEVERLKKYHKKYDGDWDLISAKLKRSITSLKVKFAQVENTDKYERNITPKKFTEEEDKELLAVVNQIKSEMTEKESGRGALPWKQIAAKMGTGRPSISVANRYGILISKAPKMSKKDITNMSKDALKLLIQLKVNDVLDVDWEKLKTILEYKGSADELKSMFKNFMKKRFNKKKGNADITTLKDRFKYLMNEEKSNNGNSSFSQ